MPLIEAHPRDRLEALGDYLDDVIRELRARGPAVTREFEEMCVKIDRMKAAFPKPSAQMPDDAIAVVVVRSVAVASSSSSTAVAASSSP